jgi:hypothetical protein
LEEKNDHEKHCNLGPSCGDRIGWSGRGVRRWNPRAGVTGQRRGQQQQLAGRRLIRRPHRA